MRDLDVDGEPIGSATGGGARPARGADKGATAAPAAPAATQPAAPERDPTADLTPEDLVLKEDPKPRQKNRRPRNRRHGRSR